MNTKYVILLIGALIAMNLTTSCAKNSGFGTSQSSTNPPSNSDEDHSGGDTGDAPIGVPDPGGGSSYKPYGLLWESSRKEGKDWSNYLYKMIPQETPGLIQGADDMDTFCPQYQTLTTNERVNLWALLISAMTKYESGYNPLSRYQETTMGKDSVTGLPVYSEGLLQLSYQDINHYKFCEFDWSKDKNLSATDPRKTILDPYKNLNCGVRILAQQVSKKNRITVGDGAYWAVIKSNSTHHKIPQIAELTKKMPGCMK
jgi:hypothetical protein